MPVSSSDKRRKLCTSIVEAVSLVMLASEAEAPALGVLCAVTARANPAAPKIRKICQEILGTAQKLRPIMASPRHPRVEIGEPRVSRE